MKSWFSIQSKKASTAEIYIYDEIGAFGIRADQLIEALKAKGDVNEIALHINSPGGDPFQAAAMYLALKRHPAKVTAFNDGLVASAASIVLMAGDHIVMAENTMLMIHDPIGGVFGTAEDMRDFAAAMDKIKQTILTAYRRSGKTDEELAEIMRNETWYTAAEALAAGFIDEISKEIPVAAFFDLKKFANPPAALLQPPSVKQNDGDIPPVQPWQRMYLSKAEAKIIADSQKIINEKANEKLIREIIEHDVAVAQACLDAGHPELTARFVARGLSPEEVKAELLKPENVSTAAATRSPDETKKIVELCMKAGVPELLEKFVNENRTVTWVEDRLKHANAIRARCAAGAMPERANSYIIANMLPQEVGNHLLELKIAMQGPEIDHYLSPEMVSGAKPEVHASNGTGHKRTTSAAEIYAMRARRPDDTAEKIIAALKGALR